ncbi:MAG TPA: hypothetical protein VF802_00455 [Candidatus Limnocylindrales bacterium]
MDAATLATLVMVVAPILLLIEGLIVLLVWGQLEGGMPWLIGRWHAAGRTGVGGASVGYWILASTATAIVGWMASFIVVHELLFAFGTTAAWAGLGGSVVLMAFVPIVWAIVIDRRSRRD